MGCVGFSLSLLRSPCVSGELQHSSDITFPCGGCSVGVHICVLGINAVLIRLDEGRFDAFGAALKLPRALHSGEHRLQVSESNLVEMTWRRKIDDFQLVF